MASILVGYTKNNRKEKIMKKKQVKASAKKSKNGETKYGKLRALLLSGKKVFSVEEMMKASGFDQNNLRVAMSILQNPKRTKEPIKSEYDREKKSYSLK
jgi:hypothetical protein